MTDREAIDKLLNEFVTAFNAADVATCVDMLADDVVAMPPNAPAMRGKQVYGTWVEELLRSVSIEETITEHEVEIAGDWAFDRGHWEATIGQRSDGAQFEDEGDYVWILKRLADGPWALAQMIWNSDKSLGG